MFHAPVFFCLFALVALATCQAHAAPPNVTAHWPLGVGTGKTVRVTCAGENLQGAAALWTSFPSESEVAGKDGAASDGKRAVVNVTTPPETPVGVYGARLTTASGISNIRLLMVDDLPTTLQSGDNHDLEHAQTLAFPCAVEGSCEPEQSDYFRISAGAGQCVTVEVVAARLATALDPVLRVLDAEGDELAYCDDDACAGADCRWRGQFEEAGDYFLELRDIRYAGGADYRYRLRVGDFPLVSAVWPPAGGTGKLTCTGPFSERPVTVTVKENGYCLADRRPIAVPGTHGFGSGWGSHVISDYDDSFESEPNDTRETSSSLLVDSAASARLAPEGDVDYFAVALSAGDEIVVQGEARAFGSPADLLMRVEASDGRVIAEADDSGEEEATLRFSASEAGVYRIRVEELARRGGEEFVYRVRCFRNPGFMLFVNADRIELPLDDAGAIKVIAIRTGYTGPIVLSVRGLDGGLLENETIAAGQRETTLKIKAPENASLDRTSIVQIVGKRESGGSPAVIVADNRATLRKALPGVVYIPQELVGRLAVGAVRSKGE